MTTIDTRALFAELGIRPQDLTPGDLVVRSPIDGSELGRVHTTPPAHVAAAIEAAVAGFMRWRVVPAPRRGELVRRFGDVLRAHKEPLATLVTLECGKILEESRGEVQEAIDICDFAVGLSRQLYGLTIASERPGHRMMETWHPLGPVGVVTAFNFPVAVWSWNFALAVVCGDPVLWKPSEQTPLCALACTRLFERACTGFEDAPSALAQLLVGGPDAALLLADDARVPLLSATGSTRMGRLLAPRVAARLGRSLLELGGNNAMIVSPSADLDLAERAIVFGAVGTAGQRCTTLRRLLVHESIYRRLAPRLVETYAKLEVGSPLAPATLVGPLVSELAFDAMQRALERARREGGQVYGGERVHEERWPNAHYVRPALVEMPGQSSVVREETFAPILYVMRYRTLDEAIALHNAVEQGLASSIFTGDVREAEHFLSPAGSDCGIVNVNLGPSGAEIGGAFGGEKATGGGREAGSDAWKSYMRRATNTINYSDALPLAQGIRFSEE